MTLFQHPVLYIIEGWVERLAALFCSNPSNVSVTLSTASFNMPKFYVLRTERIYVFSMVVITTAIIISFDKRWRIVFTARYVLSVQIYFGFISFFKILKTLVDNKFQRRCFTIHHCILMNVRCRNNSACVTSAAPLILPYARTSVLLAAGRI